jgi:hypothetical protein
VLRDPTIDLRIEEIPADFSETQALELFTQPPEFFEPRNQMHRLTVCAFGGSARYMMIEISHAIMDGASLEIVMRDFAIACDGNLHPSSSPSYHPFADYSAARNTEESGQYWTSYLQGCPSCMFPVYTHGASSTQNYCLRKDFDYPRGEALLLKCKESQITLASVMRASWALVLRSYTGSSDVSFAYIDSGRDAPVHGIENMVGLCLSTQPCRVQLVQGQSLASLVGELQRDHLNSLKYRHYPLIDLKGRLYPKDSQTMFNTAISMEWPARNDTYRDSSIMLDEIREQDDPTEVNSSCLYRQRSHLTDLNLV